MKLQDLPDAAVPLTKQRRPSKHAGGGSRKRTSTDPEPYSIWVTFVPNDGRIYTVHIRPANQTDILERKAYFTEGELRATLANCPLVDAEQVIGQAQLTGRCDLGRKKICLDVARAAALGWYQAHL